MDAIATPSNTAAAIRHQRAVLVNMNRANLTFSPAKL
jgi:hypothetical protein